MCKVPASLSEALKLKGGGVVSIVGAGGKTTLMFRLARELSGRGEPVLSTTTTRVMQPSADLAPAVLLSPDSEEILREAVDLLRVGSHLFAASGPLDAKGKLAGFGPEAIEALWVSGLFRWVLVEADGAARKPLKAPAPHEPVIPPISRWVVGVVGLDAVGQPLDDRWVFRPERYSEITGLPVGAAITEASVAAAIVHERGIMKGCPAGAARCAFLNKADLPGCGDAGRRVAEAIERTRGSGKIRAVVGSALFDPPVLVYYELESHRRGS